MPTARSIDVAAIRAAAAAQAVRQTVGIADMAGYLAKQNGDASHRDVTGPLLSASGASGVVLHRGQTLAEWGDPSVPEMLFSASKSLLATVAGVAFDQGLLAHVDEGVHASVALPELATSQGQLITWRHLLQQTSQWSGTLWGKPTLADAQSQRPGSAGEDTPPGEGWAYNDVRVNLLALALTVLFRRELPEVFATHVMRPLGASESWSWHGYADSVVEVDGKLLRVVSGGAHWGGGVFMAARDLALIGQLYLQQRKWGARSPHAPNAPTLVSERWIALSFAPCAVKPDYGFLWWRNDHGRVFPDAPTTGRCARGNGGRHLLWIDPARELVIASHWGDRVGELLRDVSRALPAE